MATIAEPPEPDDAAPSLLARLENFLWLSTGMFSLAALGLAATGYLAFGSFESGSSNFLASIASGGLFGLASLLKHAPASA